MTNKTLRLAVQFAIFSSVITSPAVLHAQSSSSNDSLLEEVFVTARRVEENLQQTPLSITAFTADTLENRQIDGTEGLDQITPNLQFTNNTPLAGNNSSSAVFIRGVGQIDPTSSVDPGVGLYIDDVYMGQSLGGSMGFRDIAGVQVLRGPQGTLFGRNTIGGAVLLSTQDPGDEVAGNFKIGIGSDNLTNIFGAIDVPLSDNVKSRFTLGQKKQDGYVTRTQTGEDLGDTNTYTFTGKFVWSISDSFEAKLKLDYSKSEENGSPFVFAASNENATFQKVASRDAGCPGAGFPTPAVPLIDDLRCANDFQNEGPYKNNGTYELTSELDNWGMSLHLVYDISDALTFKSITSYRELDWVGIRDADNTPLTILHTSYDSTGEQFSQEFQFVYEADSYNGVMGLYYADESSDDIVYVQLNTPAPGTQEDSDNNLTENSNWALFTQWTFDLSDRLALTLGGRYTEDTKGSTPDQFSYANPTNKYLPVQLYEETFTKFTWSGTASYDLTDASMVYFSYSEGFKGGGWNSHFNTCQVQACINNLTAPPDIANATAAAAVFPLVHSFEPEEVETIELGVKADLSDNFRLNAALFTTDYDDMQFVYRAGVAPYLANAGKASIDGAELEFTWVPVATVTVEGGIGILESSVEELATIAGLSQGVSEGNVLTFAPEMQANLGLSFDVSLTNDLLLTPRIDLIYQDETYFDAGNTREIAQLSSYNIVNIGFLLQPGSESWQVHLGINNANDELYSTGGNSSLSTGSGYAEIAYARPREVFLNYSREF